MPQGGRIHVATGHRDLKPAEKCATQKARGVFLLGEGFRMYGMSPGTGARARVPAFLHNESQRAEAQGFDCPRSTNIVTQNSGQADIDR